MWNSRDFFPETSVDSFRCKSIHHYGVWHLHRFKLQGVFFALVVASTQIHLSLAVMFKRNEVELHPWSLHPFSAFRRAPILSRFRVAGAHLR